MTRIVNFAHGSLYMLGIYVAYGIITWADGGAAGFWGGVIAAALIVGGAGALIEIAILRRIYHAPELFQLLATFALALVIKDLAALGRRGPARAPRAGLRGSVDILGIAFPEYDLFLIAVGPLVLGALWLLLNRTRWGRESGGPRGTARWSARSG